MLPSILSFFPGSSSVIFHPSGTGVRRTKGFQWVHSASSLPFFLLFLSCFVVGPSRRLQFSKNCSSIGLLHGVQSFRNGHHQHESSTVLQVLPEDLLQHGLLFMGPQVLPEACSSMGSPGEHSLLRAHPPALAFMGQRVDICSTTDLRMGCRGTTCFTIGVKWSRWISALLPGAPPSSLPLVSAELFFSHFLISLSQPLHSIFLSFLKCFIREASSALQIGSALASSWFSWN